MVRNGGSRATPTVLKVLRGNPSKQNLAAIQAREPKSPPASIDPPDYLEGLALQKWNDTVPILSTMRVWGEAERESWMRYCQVHALWAECYEVISKQGQAYEKPSGVIAARPEASLLIQYSAQLIRLEVEFGLTPSSRAGAATIGEDEADPMEAFLREPAG